MAIRVEQTASSSRSIVPAGNGRRRREMRDPSLLFWTKLIELAFADAKRTRHGLPTDSAILSRWWIEEHRPQQSDKDEWERSFEACCGWLSLDAATERKRLVTAIERSLASQYERYARAYVYQRRAQVLTCAGMKIAICRQFIMPLVSEDDYEQVAGIEHGDPPPITERRTHSKAA